MEDLGKGVNTLGYLVIGFVALIYSTAFFIGGSGPAENKKSFRRELSDSVERVIDKEFGFKNSDWVPKKHDFGYQSLFKEVGSEYRNH